MAGHGGKLSLLTIAAIFLVVFGLIQGGAQLAEGELLPEKTTTESEDTLRDAIWAELNERREAREERPMPHDRFVRGLAQDTTDSLVAELADGPDDRRIGDVALTNTRLFCTQVPVSVPLNEGRATAETATRVGDALEAAAGPVVFSRSPAQFRAGMGIAVRDDVVYVVYRSCEQVDT